MCGQLWIWPGLCGWQSLVQAELAKASVLEWVCWNWQLHPLLALVGLGWIYVKFIKSDGNGFNHFESIIFFFPCSDQTCEWWSGMSNQLWIRRRHCYCAVSTWRQMCGHENKHKAAATIVRSSEQGPSIGKSRCNVVWSHNHQWHSQQDFFHRCETRCTII